MSNESIDETIDMRPLGFTVPGGPERITKSWKEYNEVSRRLCDRLLEILGPNRDRFEETLTEIAYPSDGLKSHLHQTIVDDALALYDEYCAVREEVQRAVCNVPPRNATH